MTTNFCSRSRRKRQGGSVRRESAAQGSSAHESRRIDGRSCADRPPRRASRAASARLQLTSDTMTRGWIDKLLHTHDSPERTARAFAVGVFFGFSPFLGLHTILGTLRRVHDAAQSGRGSDRCLLESPVDSSGLLHAGHGCRRRTDSRRHPARITRPVPGDDARMSRGEKSASWQTC